MDLTLSSKLLDAATNDGKTKLILEIMEKLRVSAHSAVTRAFNREAELMAYTGKGVDQESLRALLRSVQATISPTWPPEIVVEFGDEYRHWYMDGKLPNDLASTIQKIIDTSIENWIKSPEVSEIFSEILSID